MNLAILPCISHQCTTLARFIRRETLSNTRKSTTKPQAEDLDLAISTTDAALAAYIRPGMVYNKV